MCDFSMCWVKSFIVLLSLFCGVLTCYHAAVNNREVCNSFDDFDGDATETWSKVIVQRKGQTPRITLKENSFVRGPNLKELSIYQLVNKIEDGAFRGLEKLEKLSISDNDLEEISPDIFIGLNIRQVLLTNNNMKSIPVGLFKHVPKIRIVSIDENSIKEVKTGIFNGSGMVNIYLQGNGIETIEDGAFANMESLRNLKMSGNQLKTFEAKRILGYNPSLYGLTLNKNKFETISRDMFTGLPNLEQLFLQLNQIKHIEKEAFVDLPKLEFLEIANNELKVIKKNMFPKSGMRNLKAFFVHNNQLTFVDLAILARLPNLFYFTYFGNPLQCPCLKDIKTFMGEKKVKFLCTDEYFADGRPQCLESSISSITCIYDVDINKDLIPAYKTKLSNYKELPLICNTIGGFETAALSDRKY